MRFYSLQKRLIRLTRRPIAREPGEAETCLHVAANLLVLYVWSIGWKQACIVPHIRWRPSRPTVYVSEGPEAEERNNSYSGIPGHGCLEWRTEEGASSKPETGNRKRRYFVKVTKYRV